MSKSFLVIDTPENCSKCPCHFTDMVGIDEDGKEKFFRFLCGAENKEITEKVNSGRQDWCPLKDMPEKKKLKTVITYFEGWNSGYNACIDEILKGTNENE